MAHEASFTVTLAQKLRQRQQTDKQSLLGVTEIS